MSNVKCGNVECCVMCGAAGMCREAGFGMPAWPSNAFQLLQRCRPQVVQVAQVAPEQLELRAMA
jgi:hypothetical protein